MNRGFRSFAILPAAGTSSRMGRPKLTIPIDGKAIIHRAIEAFQAGGVDIVLVVVRPDDMMLAEIAKSAGATVVQPEVAPPEMKISVLAALNHISQTCSPTARDAWLMSPADIPYLSSKTIGRLLDHHSPTAPVILVPCHGKRRGHPVLMPWGAAARVANLTADEGVNSLIDSGPTEYLELGVEAVPEDVDRPEDVARAEGRVGREE